MGTISAAKIENNVNSDGKLAAKDYFVNHVNQVVAEVDQRMNGELAQEPSEYPCIDISSWMTTDNKKFNQEDRDKVAAQVAQQAIEAGSFNIVGHGIDLEFLDRLDEQSKKFFGMSLEDKKKHSIEASHHGYIPIQSESASTIYNRQDCKETEKKDLRELFAAVYPVEGNESEEPSFYREVLNEFMHHMNKLDRVLHKILALALARAKGVTLPESLFNDAKGTATAGLLRVSHYASMPPEFDNAFKLAPHSDWGPLTILYSHQVQGLEEERDGKWIQVPARRGEVHIVIGEVISAWSNLLFKNNVHYVSQQAPPDRVSYAYFCGQGFDLTRRDTDEDGMEPVCAPGETPKFGRISPRSHLLEYTKVYLSSNE
ncbi:Flavonol synthase/flavanone 3-hydroxylase [Seminavis robusta]|uniref:Flavonol synthase/flavanone 3-hydroxylase n=1 Tax=Seminavis robusta TaxID=568900 RepID=A0A9N8EQA1_9STRA|nr:Flavonol synthase/flavanone 3-hydroxylase [Seminavis robusta]|eukprot:Sro1427_g271780.1 Flavonol synthase/flavanone 3-hydroxylase (372) ;mRNA; f:7121-8236